MDKLKRAKWMIGLVAAGLFLSGVTLWPVVWELETIVDLVWGDAGASGPVHALMLDTIEAIRYTESRYPFLLYGYDWLAFAHIMLAILFFGAIRDPVRNVWVVQFGLIACAAVPVLAGVCIPLRHMPFAWFWVDVAFAPLAAIPLAIALRDIGTQACRPG